MKHPLFIICILSCSKRPGGQIPGRPGQIISVEDLKRENTKSGSLGDEKWGRRDWPSSLAMEVVRFKSIIFHKCQCIGSQSIDWHPCSPGSRYSRLERLSVFDIAL